MNCLLGNRSAEEDVVIIVALHLICGSEWHVLEAKPSSEYKQHCCIQGMQSNLPALLSSAEA